jgi:hypothetical protein
VFVWFLAHDAMLSPDERRLLLFRKHHDRAGPENFLQPERRARVSLYFDNASHGDVPNDQNHNPGRQIVCAFMMKAAPQAAQSSLPQLKQHPVRPRHIAGLGVRFRCSDISIPPIWGRQQTNASLMYYDLCFKHNSTTSDLPP